MTRLEKCELLKQKGYTYNPVNGKIYGIHGKEIISKHNLGYIFITLRLENKVYKLLGHHFAYFMTYGNQDFILLDHINRDRTDNRINNLRNTSYRGNQQNRNAKGYSIYKNGKYGARIMSSDGKLIHLGIFNTKKEARQAYLNAKPIYHKD